jgi:Holliday junction resolvase RusA-like endonuclease
MKIEFTAYGLPKPAGSKRGFLNKHTGRVSLVDACKDTKSWQHVVSTAAREAYSGPLLRTALVAHFRFYFPRPKAHFGSGKNAAVLKESAPAFLTKAPDALKLSRAVEDSMQGVVYENDSQIVNETIMKEWGEPARVEVCIQPLEQ